ncbi:MAG: NADP-dependent oxidoreductase [Rhodospirillales bacterium]|nr:NADP-dependent oxidoreductase [Rhodospirillales bacterium]
MTENRQILLTARPDGLPKITDFKLVTSPVPEPGEGEMLVRTLYLSLDPYMRGRMRDERSYASPVALDEVMVGGVVGEVAASRHPDYSVGDMVEGRTGWQDFGLSDGSGMRKIDPTLAPVSTALGILGMPGLTAYFGLREIGRVKSGDTVLVTAASGAVGAVVGQIAKIMGCRVIGIAGGPRKCAYILSELGFDAAIDYKSGADLDTAMATACPDGVDVYFDNVGGAISDVVLDHLARGARVAICGTISQTSLSEPELGPRVQGKLMTAWASMQAFNVFQFTDRHDEGRAQLARWLADGKLKYREDVVDGLENAPAAFIGMLRGENFGKLIVKVGQV